MSKFHHLPNEARHALPEQFTFPFYYTPHPLTVEAADILQKYLSNQVEFDHNFGLDSKQKGMEIGKMFGVLVCENQQGELGFLAAFSGKLANQNHWNYFVPPVFDMLIDDGYFLKKEIELNSINHHIDQLQNATSLKKLREELELYEKNYQTELQILKINQKRQKYLRDAKREHYKQTLNEVEFEEENQKLIDESLAEKRKIRDLKLEYDSKIKVVQDQLNHLENEIEQLKNKRKNKSNHLQEYLFGQYRFLNILGQQKSLLEIFGKNPPSAAGECAAPKLLNYAFLHNLKPICMAEFWWGKSPKSAIRKHQHFYPACTAKCQPILSHMLLGMEVEENPMRTQNTKDKKIEILFEDRDILVINKPENFLSVPGIAVKDSVQERLKLMYPEITSPMMVHRLDMQTSGLLVIAKNKLSHERLQKQFLKKKVNKRYIALLDGIIENQTGEINLPLRVDLDDRPRQLVCYEHGKPAVTKYEVIGFEANKTRIYFYPITGRTHQLRVHASHPSGLNMPIVGDDLYGKKGKRLCLHAEKIEFFHPISNKKLIFSSEPNF
ncbi:pseudouridine synthase [Vaginella massiliensis]|uniref:RluA family pseudouridine synthase n=1 Tax=Vaginella massiliensis TaxID=1816680 RepID=UPI0008393E2D|nr:RluA family pseudouridine synthase [Vaginella massiliensis]